MLFCILLWCALSMRHFVASSRSRPGAGCQELTPQPSQRLLPLARCLLQGRDNSPFCSPCLCLWAWRSRWTWLASFAASTSSPLHDSNDCFIPSLLTCSESGAFWLDLFCLRIREREAGNKTSIFCSPRFRRVLLELVLDTESKGM